MLDKEAAIQQNIMCGIARISSVYANTMDQTAPFGLNIYSRNKITLVDPCEMV